MSDLRVIVTGATGNVGSAVLDALTADVAVGSVVGLARRAPLRPRADVEIVTANVTSDDMVAAFRGADAVIHLAWAIQPSRRRDVTRAINVDGSRRVFSAVAAAGVPALIHASSVGAYGPGPGDGRAVDETWPTTGIPSSFYSVDKAAVERELDRFEAAHPDVRVVRLRPGLIFQHRAGAEMRKLFTGPFLPRFLMQPRFIPVVPDTPGLRFQAVHADDVADAYRRAVIGDVRGAFNIAATPILDPTRLGQALNARPVAVPARVLRAAAALTWRMRLQPTPPGWIDLALQSPLMRTDRAEQLLGWHPACSSTDALLELLHAIRVDAGAPTPPLSPDSGGPPLHNQVDPS